MPVVAPNPARIVAVFGAAGIVGSRIVAALSHEGRRVLAVSRRPEAVAPRPGVAAVAYESFDPAAPPAAVDAAIVALPAAPAAVLAARLKGRVPRRIAVVRTADDPSAFDAAAIVLRLGGLCGDGIAGPFRAVFEGLRNAAPPAGNPSLETLDFLDPRDGVSGVLDALRFGGDGVYDLVAERGTFDDWTARSAAIFETYGWSIPAAPLRGESGGRPATVLTAADARPRAEWAWAPRRTFESAVVEMCERASAATGANTTTSANARAASP